MFNATNMLCSVDPLNGKFLTCSAIFRGKVSHKEVTTELSKISSKTSSNFVEWIPNNYKYDICEVWPNGLINKTVTLIANSTAI